MGSCIPCSRARPPAHLRGRQKVSARLVSLATKTNNKMDRFDARGGAQAVVDGIVVACPGGLLWFRGRDLVKRVGWSGVEQGWWASIWVGRLTCKAAAERGQGAGVELPVCVLKWTREWRSPGFRSQPDQGRVCVVGGMSC